MIEPNPVRHHMTRRHYPVRLCDGQPADDDDIPTTDIDALRDARAEATLCPIASRTPTSTTTAAAIGSHSMRMLRLFFKMANTAAGNRLYTRAAGGGNTSLLLQKIQRPGTHTIPIAVATIQNCHDTE